jgi:hypothetical protein
VVEESRHFPRTNQFQSSAGQYPRNFRFRVERFDCLNVWLDEQQFANNSFVSLSCKPLASRVEFSPLHAVLGL